MILFLFFSIETEDDDVLSETGSFPGKTVSTRKTGPSQFFFFNSTRERLCYASLRCYALPHTLVCLNCAFAEANCVVVDETANMISI